MRLFGGRAHTVFNTPPAPVPRPDLQEQADAGKIRLDHLARRAELTVAASQEMFAAQAVRELRGH